MPENRRSFFRARGCCNRRCFEKWFRVRHVPTRPDSGLGACQGCQPSQQPMMASRGRWDWQLNTVVRGIRRWRIHHTLNCFSWLVVHKHLPPWYYKSFPIQLETEIDIFPYCNQCICWGIGDILRNKAHPWHPSVIDKDGDVQSDYVPWVYFKTPTNMDGNSKS